MGFDQAHGVPQISSTTFLRDVDLSWGREEWKWSSGNKVISGAARDAGNDVTNILRAGLALGEITATRKLKEWNPSATDGSQNLYGFLDIRDLDVFQDGANADRLIGRILIRGGIKASSILIPGEATEGISGKDNEYLIRNACAADGNRFLLDDFNAGGNRQRTVTGNTTLTGRDHDSIIDNIGASGSITITLPAPKRGLHFRFLQLAGQNIVLNSSATNEFIPVGGTPADSFTCGSTVYGMFEVWGYSNALYVASRLPV